MRARCRRSGRLSSSKVGPVKNKRLLYILLPAVLLIWGLIFQRIWQAAQGHEESASAVDLASVAATASTVAAQTPRLLLNYADPFRASSPNTPLVAPTVAMSSVQGSYTQPLSPAPLNLPVAPAAVTVIPVVWPLVKYLGSINNPRLENRIALLTINEKEYSLKSGGNKEEITVSKIWRDSVQVVFRGSKKTLTRILSN